MGKYSHAMPYMSCDPLHLITSVYKCHVTHSISSPQYAVQVLDLVRGALPMVLVAYQQLTGGQGTEEGKVYSDTKHRHYAVIESEHPYKQACVTHHKVPLSVLKCASLLAR